ncbi:LmeA family phospholipid-binding protein [Nocardia sp. NBC_01503]|uniref:LmeA family phospholipid-binding protein n=1 Tax=Nocardia sp. NBC_01503 TaxID=2975997 RepID=UPI002E7AC874|nr:LmeA family phospholipid-binding protein [Nocardia sp. NBC_01503]WTL32702.1 LmeA family phospholipid-binding protein [Nocardia sp. NBC_01503]
MTRGARQQPWHDVEVRTLLVTLVLIIGLAIAADFGAAAYAENAAAEAMRNTANLGSNPSVDIKGFPVLLQAAKGKYDDLEIKANHVGTEKFGFVDVAATLHGVELPLTDLANRELHRVPVDRLEATARFNALRPMVLLDVAGLLPFGVVPTSIHMDGTTVIVTGTGKNVLVDIDQLKGK